MELQAQEILTEIQQLHQGIQVGSSLAASELAAWNEQRARMEDFKEFWNIITEERQQRSKLEHNIRQMEIEMMEMKNQVQNCSARLQQQSKGGCCIYQSDQNPCCCHIAHCLTYEVAPVVDRSSSLVTLV